MLSCTLFSYSTLLSPCLSFVNIWGPVPKTWVIQNARVRCDLHEIRRGSASWILRGSRSFIVSCLVFIRSAKTTRYLLSPQLQGFPAWQKVLLKVAKNVGKKKQLGWILAYFCTVNLNTTSIWPERNNRREKDPKNQPRDGTSYPLA